MDYAVENKNNAWQLLAFFVFFTLLGSALSVFYVFASPFVTYIQLKIIVVAFYIMGLCGLAIYLMKILKVTSDKGAIIAIFLGLLIINYIKWNFYFTLTLYKWGFEEDILSGTLYSLISPQWFVEKLIFFNENSGYTYSTNYSETVIPGFLIWIVWGFELFCIVSAPILSCLKNTGVYINDSQKLIKPIFLGYYFSAFDKEAVAKIMEKDISVIVNQPAVLRPVGKSYWTVGYFSIDGGDYEHIALYKNSALGLRKKTPLIYIGNDLFKQLQAELFKKYFPDFKQDN